MNNNTFIEMNKNGWNELIKQNKPFANTILPEYGPFLKKRRRYPSVYQLKRCQSFRPRLWFWRISRIFISKRSSRNMES